MTSSWSAKIFLRACREANIPPFEAGQSLSTAMELQAGGSFENFLQLMHNRLLFGCCRYGPALKDPLSFLGRMKIAIQQYEANGNTEKLVDVANYAFLEFANPQHKDAHFEADDQGMERK